MSSIIVQATDILKQLSAVESIMESSLDLISTSDTRIISKSELFSLLKKQPGIPVGISFVPTTKANQSACWNWVGNNNSPYMIDIVDVPSMVRFVEIDKDELFSSAISNKSGYCFVYNHPELKNNLTGIVERINELGNIVDGVESFLRRCFLGFLMVERNDEMNVELDALRKVIFYEI